MEETAGGRGRERWWRPTSELHDWSDEATEGDPDAQAAAGWLREHYLRTFLEQAEHWLEHHDNWPLAWRRLAGSSDYVLELTATQLEALLTELWAVIARVHAETTSVHDAGAGADEPPGERRQRVLLYLHDFPEGERPR